MGGAGAADGQGDCRDDVAVGGDDRLGGGGGGECVCAAGVAGVGDAGGCAGRCGGVCACDDVDSAVAVGLCAVYPVVAWGQRYIVATGGVAGVDVYRAGADAGVDSRLVRLAAYGHSECGVCRVGG